MPFCTGCGVRVDAGVTRCPACESKAAATRRCPRCGAGLAGVDSRFCIACGASLAASAAPGPAGRPGPAPSVRSAEPAARGTDPKGTVAKAREERAGVYQRLGRLLISSCYDGKLPYDRMPEELARQTRAGIETIRKGHAQLAAAGICPRCLEPTLSGDPPTCRRCRLIVPAVPAPRTA
jgi:hypothetical protein